MPNRGQGRRADKERVTIARLPPGQCIFCRYPRMALLRTYPPEDYSGIIVLRLARQDKPRILTVIRQLVPILEQEPLSGKLWIVEDFRIRIHG